MRMWGVPPQSLCRKHLLGEHVELHMFVGAINKNKSLSGFIEKNLVDILQIASRHTILVDEMARRGYNHQSELPEFEYEPEEKGTVDVEANLNELSRRCPDCAHRISLMRMKGETSSAIHGDSGVCS